MIDLKKITLKYRNGTVALKDMNIEIRKGELVFIIGESGSGKTSLLKLFMGMVVPTEGIVMIDNQDINKMNASHKREVLKSMGPIFQEFKLMKGTTTIENVMLGLRFYGYDNNYIRTEAINTLKKVGLSHKANIKIEDLSWGENQRVAIARAIARKPKIIIADEPTGNLDHDNAVNILNLLSSLRDENTTVIITTHATHLIGLNSDVRVIQLKDGQMIGDEKRVIS
ncbi:MAG: ATP-binding cassette domain-containing protein [Clostridiales bacterium]|nr:ATP-binding cassette domain-containing protein [Clostridiales bacterium]